MGFNSGFKGLKNTVAVNGFEFDLVYGYKVK